MTPADVLQVVFALAIAVALPLWVLRNPRRINDAAEQVFSAPNPPVQQTPAPRWGLRDLVVVGFIVSLFS